MEIKLKIKATLLRLKRIYYKLKFYGKCPYTKICQNYDPRGLYCKKQKGYINEKKDECGTKRELKRVRI